MGYRSLKTIPSRPQKALTFLGVLGHPPRHGPSHASAVVPNSQTMNPNPPDRLLPVPFNWERRHPAHTYLPSAPGRTRPGGGPSTDDRTRSRRLPAGAVGPLDHACDDRHHAMRLAQDDHVVNALACAEPIKRSTYAFCQGERGAICRRAAIEATRLPPLECRDVFTVLVFVDDSVDLATLASKPHHIIIANDDLLGWQPNH
jgi:hypothetical protein